MRKMCYGQTEGQKKVSPMMRRNFIQVIEAEIAGESIPALQRMWNQGGGIHIQDFFYKQLLYKQPVLNFFG